MAWVLGVLVIMIAVESRSLDDVVDAGFTSGNNIQFPNLLNNSQCHAMFIY